MRLIHFIVLLLAIALSPTSPVAQANPSSTPTPSPPTRADEFTANPFQSLLAPADTSSPRGTLRSFLTDAEIVIESMRSDGLHVNAAAFRAYQRTLTTLDFSATPQGDTRDVMNARVFMLHEMLARLELPPDDDIPGVEEVARLGLREWTIPGTPLTIRRIETGPRTREFVFSAGTVQRLPYYYRLVKHLPYRPGATPGFFEEHLSVEGALARSAAAVRHRLKAIDTSNPRSTLFGFLESVNQAHALVMETNAALAATPPRITREEVIQAENEAWLLLRRAKNTLDLSAVPEVLRRYVGAEAVLQLKEILDRQFLPVIDSIPDLEMIEAERERLSRLGVPDRPIRWTYPSTDLQIVEIMEGERRGQFLFDANTVSRLASDYRKIRDLPYRKDYEDIALFYGSLLHLTEGFYEYYLATPGKLIPQATFVGRLVDSLPDGFKTQRLGQPLWQWFGLLLGLLTILLGGYGILRGSNWLARRVNPPLRAWLKAAAPALAALLVVLVVQQIEDELNVGAELSVVATVSRALVAGLLIWTVFRLSRAIADTIVASPKIQDLSLDASLARIAARIVGFVIGGYILFTTLRALGADLLPLLAGLGVGGLAVALAAQRTLANFIGSLILFASQPVRLGDLIRYGDQVGTVEKIGLLATQIRSLERTVVTVPNAEFSEMQLDNFTKRDQRLLRTVLQLRYETTPEQLRYVLAKLRALLIGHPKVTPAPARVRFVGYGAFSKDVEVFAYLSCQDQDTFLAIQEDILLRMEDIVNAAGSGFAFPSQTTYLTRDRGLDLERRSEAETQVRDWRDRGKLPFPEFAESEGERLKNILDYPPKGSPHYEAPEPPWLVKAAPASQAFQENDLLELPDLVAKLRAPNPLSDYLRNQLSEETRKLLSNYEGGLDDPLKSALVDDLNAVLTGPALHDPDRFAKVRLSASTRELLDRHPEGEDLVRLNRLLLEDAYPKALGGRTQA